jgi:hypothetical protein
MTNIFDAYGTDLDLEENGVWVELMKGAEFKICAFGNKAHKKILERLRKPYAAQIRRGTLDEDIDENIHVQAIAKTILVDWKGEAIVDPDTLKPMKYSYDNALKLLRDERLKRLKGQIVNVALEQETFKLTEEEESVKNSKKSSDGN